jgi:hypothetical protein
VFMLANTFYGQANTTNATVTFKGSGGTAVTAKLVGNSTIRDYNNWVWTNTINGTTAQEWWTNNLHPSPQDQSKRLDAHSFNLATKFAGETLTHIVVTAPTNAGPNFMEPVLWAVDIARAGTGGISSTCSTK